MLFKKVGWIVWCLQSRVANISKWNCKDFQLCYKYIMRETIRISSVKIGQIIHIFDENENKIHLVCLLVNLLAHFSLEWSVHDFRNKKNRRSKESYNIKSKLRNSLKECNSFEKMDDSGIFENKRLQCQWSGPHKYCATLLAREKPIVNRHRDA